MVFANGSLSGLAKNAAKNVINYCLGSFSQVCTSSSEFSLSGGNR